MKIKLGYETFFDSHPLLSREGPGLPWWWSCRNLTIDQQHNVDEEPLWEEAAYREKERVKTQHPAETKRQLKKQRE